MGIYGGVGYRGKPYGGYRVGLRRSGRGGGVQQEQSVEAICQKAEVVTAEPIDLPDLRYCHDCQHTWYGNAGQCPACWGQRTDVYTRRQLGLRVYLIPQNDGLRRRAAEREFAADCARRGVTYRPCSSPAIDAVEWKVTWLPRWRRRRNYSMSSK